MQTLIRHIDVFADYFQFYVCDASFKTDTGTIWDEVAADRMLALGHDLIAVGTARNMDVPVTLEVLASQPSNDFDEWDQVIDCAVMIPSGNLIVFGCTENPDDAERLQVAPGSYAARVSYAQLAELSDNGLEGDDRYRIQLWPGPPTPLTVVKRRAA